MILDTERRRFERWCAIERGITEFPGRWAKSEWIFLDAAVQRDWKIWQSAMTFRTLGNL